MAEYCAPAPTRRARAVQRLASSVAVLLLAVALAPLARACGYHDPSSMNRGMLNIVYPNVLYVGTAVWQAQRDGLIPGATIDTAADEQAAMLAKMQAYRATAASLGRFRDELARALDGQAVPGFTLLLFGPMLWTRYQQAGTQFDMLLHADGPAGEDVVVVTDAPVVSALVDGQITPVQARELGLVRFYGSPADVQRVVSLFDRAAPSGAASVAEAGREAGQHKPGPSGLPASAIARFR